MNKHSYGIAADSIIHDLSTEIHAQIEKNNKLQLERTEEVKEFLCRFSELIQENQELHKQLKAVTAQLEFIISGEHNG